MAALYILRWGGAAQWRRCPAAEIANKIVCLSIALQLPYSTQLIDNRPKWNIASNPECLLKWVMTRIFIELGQLTPDSNSYFESWFTFKRIKNHNSPKILNCPSSTATARLTQTGRLVTGHSGRRRRTTGRLCRNLFPKTPRSPLDWTNDKEEDNNEFSIHRPASCYAAGKNNKTKWPNKLWHV